MGSLHKKASAGSRQGTVEVEEQNLIFYAWIMPCKPVISHFGTTRFCKKSWLPWFYWKQGTLLPPQVVSSISGELCEEFWEKQQQDSPSYKDQKSISAQSLYNHRWCFSLPLTARCVIQNLTYVSTCHEIVSRSVWCAHEHHRSIIGAKIHEEVVFWAVRFC